MRIRALASETVRMMLTGNADLGTAAKAINEGNIFRLSKPCDKERLQKALGAGLAQHKLIVEEKRLLEQTLSGRQEVTLALMLGLANLEQAVAIDDTVQVLCPKQGAASRASS